LTPRLVRFTGTAQDHVRREKAWWFENRTDTEIFATEIEHALKILAVLQGAGALYPQAGVVGRGDRLARTVGAPAPAMEWTPPAVRHHRTNGVRPL